jgi:hypothetical protein
MAPVLASILQALDYGVSVWIDDMDYFNGNIFRKGCTQKISHIGIGFRKAVVPFCPYQTARCPPGEYRLPGCSPLPRPRLRIGIVVGIDSEFVLG